MKPDVLVELKALRLHGMAGAWSDLVEQGGNAGIESSRWLIEHLLQAEGTDRSMRSVSHQMKAAKFPVHRDMAGFDFEVSPVDRKLVTTLSNTAFTDDAHNVVLVGGPGTGKTHLATAIGVAGVTRHGKRVRFYSTVDLVNALEQEKAQGKAGRIATSLLRLDLGAAVPSAQPPVRAHQRNDHDQPGLRGMVQRLRRREDDHGAAGSPHASLPHRGDRQRVDPLQSQHGRSQEANQGERADTQGRKDRG